MKNPLFSALFSQLRALGLAVLLGLSPAALAQTDWTGDDAVADDSWANDENWDGDAPGVTTGNTTTDEARFGAGPTNTTIDVDENRLIHTIEFVDSSTPGYTFTGETLRIADGGGIERASLSSQTHQTFNAPILLQTEDTESDGTFTFSENSSSNTSATFIYAGGISGSTTSGSVTLEVRGSSNAGHNFEGVISDGGAAGGLTLDVDHSGRTHLRQGNTYSGGTVWGGTGRVLLELAAGEELLEEQRWFGTGDITVKTLLQFRSGANSLTIDNNINLNGEISVVNSGSFTFNGDITLGTVEGATPFLNQNGGIQSYNGVISDGDYVVPLLGPVWGGGITLNGNNTFSGGFVMQNIERRVTLGHDNALGTGTLFVTESGGELRGGTLTIPNTIELDGPLHLHDTTFTMTGNMQVGVDPDATTPLVLSSNDDTTVFEGVISDGGNNRALTINNGTWVFTNNNTLTGDITVEVGTLQIGNGGATGIIGTAAVTLEDATTLRFNRTGSYTAVNTIDGEGNLEIQGGGSATFTGALTHEGTTSVTGNSTLAVDGSHTGGGNYTIAGGSTLSGAGSIGVGDSSITLASGAFLAPGSLATPGTLNIEMTIEGALDLTALSGADSGNMIFRLGSLSDSVATTGGAVIFGFGDLGWNDFDFVLGSGFGPGTYTLFSNDGGLFGSLDANNTDGELNGFDASLFLDGNNLMLTVIPEPATVAAILGTLALGLAFWRRRTARRV